MAALSPTSDVNLLLVLRRFAPERIARLRDGLLAAEAAIKLRVMLVLEDELPSAAELFAQKFADILRRHRTVLGKDLVGALQIPRSAEIFRLRQVLLNLVLRLREAYATRGHRPEQVVHLLAETVGPLRAACATLLELEGAPAADSSARSDQRRCSVRRARCHGAGDCGARWRAGRRRGRTVPAAGAGAADLRACGAIDVTGGAACSPSISPDRSSWPSTPCSRSR